MGKSIDRLTESRNRTDVGGVDPADGSENIAGPDYAPTGDIYKWASQRGSAFIGDQKVAVMVPRLRGTRGEVTLPSYAKLRERGQFSEELLTKMMSGLSARRYSETVQDAARVWSVAIVGLTPLCRGHKQTVETIFRARSL
ncbi:MAG: hypothetical protein IPL83_02395 [Bdellovibrionales bacterium]|nr:hypothetical protein [Bdellovibrionales bacterium]